MLAMLGTLGTQLVALVALFGMLSLPALGMSQVAPDDGAPRTDQA